MMRSVIPDANAEQAISVAVRIASSRVVPEAVRQSVRPLNVMQILPVTWFRPRLDHTISASAAATTTIVATTTPVRLPII